MTTQGATLRDCRVLVTGAGSGIGAAVARRLVAEEADIVVADRDADSVRVLAEEIGAEALVVDLADPEEATEIGEQCDVIVNNAGQLHLAPLHRFPPELFSRVLRVTVEAPFRIIRSALPGMYARGWGRIVNISSVHGLRADPYNGAYVAAKHGLEGLSKAIAVEGAPYGVTSNCVSPGYVRTPMVERQIIEQAALYRVPREQVVDDVLLARTPIKRLVGPGEVADLVAWLCGPAATSVTGASFTMDGGWSAH